MKTENQRLRELRRNLALNQEEFAAKIGIKQGSLSDIERGKVGISADVLKKIIEIFRINEEWILYGKGEMYKDYKSTSAYTMKLSIPKVNEPAEEYKRDETTAKLIEALEIIIKMKDELKYKDETIAALREEIERRNKINENKD